MSRNSTISRPGLHLQCGLVCQSRHADFFRGEKPTRSQENPHAWSKIAISVVVRELFRLFYKHTSQHTGTNKRASHETLREVTMVYSSIVDQAIKPWFIFLQNFQTSRAGNIQADLEKKIFPCIRYFFDLKKSFLWAFLIQGLAHCVCELCFQFNALPLRPLLRGTPFPLHLNKFEPGSRWVPAALARATINKTPRWPVGSAERTTFAHIQKDQI